MGYAMAEQLAKAGFKLRGYQFERAPKAEGLQNAGVTLVDHPSDLSDCDIVFTMVSTADDLQSVLNGPNGLFSRPNRAPDSRGAVDHFAGGIGANSRVRREQGNRDAGRSRQRQ